MQSEQFDNLDKGNIEENGGSFSIRNILIVLFRHKWKIVIVFVLGCIVGTVLMFTTPDVYESHAQLLIKPGGRENISWDTSVLSPGVNMSRQDDLSAELSILTSGYVIERVVEKIGAENLLPGSRQGSTSAPREQAVKKVFTDLTVGTGKNSQIVNLSFKSQDTRIAREVLETLIDIYMERHIEVHQQLATPKFFREQSEKLLSELKKKEEKYKQYCDKQGIVSLEEQKLAFLEQISELDKESDDVDGIINASQGKIAWLEKNLEERSETIEISKVTGVMNPVADDIKKRLIDLRFREVELANRYPDDSRLLIDLRKQISFAEKELTKEQETNTELTTGIDANYQAIQLELETLQSQLKALIARKQFLKQIIAKRKADLVELGNHETVLSGMQREVDVARDEYRQYRDSYQKVRISAALDAGKITNVSILQPATIPYEPVKSKKRRNVAMSLFVGLAGGIGLAYVREFLDDTIKTHDDVEKRLGLQVLATVAYKKP